MKAKDTPPRLEDIELHADAWARFERAARVVAQHPPIHRPAKTKRRKRRKKVSPGKA